MSFKSVDVNLNLNFNFYKNQKSNEQSRITLPTTNISIQRPPNHRHSYWSKKNHDIKNIAQLHRPRITIPTPIITAIIPIRPQRSQIYP